MKITWSPLAVERMAEISDYIAYDKPSAATRWVDSIFNKVNLLRDNPKMGRVVPEIDVPGIREIVYGNYRIIYRYAENSLNILTVRSFRQILPVEDIGSDR
ncbi:MAG: type II toxin-antitoxin system RelE/ParE family toxin [bacterium]